MVNCNAQSSSSRNTYLLELAAVNAHTSKLHTKHLPALFKVCIHISCFSCANSSVYATVWLNMEFSEWLRFHRAPVFYTGV